MRHLNKINKLGRTTTHRHAMLKNLAMSVLDKEHVITTLAKAKVVRGVVERLITHAKKGNVHAIRIAGKTVTDKTILKKLFSDIAVTYKAREGGYTRILKLGERPGDNATKCIIELVGRNSQELVSLRKKKKRVMADTPEITKDSAVKKNEANSEGKDSITKEEKTQKVARKKKAIDSSKKETKE